MVEERQQLVMDGDDLLSTNCHHNESHLSNSHAKVGYYYLDTHPMKYMMCANVF